jgi:hypothetical protein
MLDDFKTELKRLGMKRIQKEEMRRQSVALVLDDKDDPDYDGEVEYADALNTPSKPRRGSRFSSANSPTGRLRHDSLSNGSSLSGKRFVPKPQIGKGGTIISQLPGLKRLSFGKRKEESNNNTQDLEKQSENGQERHLSPSTERVNNMRGSLGVVDFHTKPAGI